MSWDWLRAFGDTYEFLGRLAGTKRPSCFKGLAWAAVQERGHLVPAGRASPGSAGLGCPFLPLWS